MKVHIVSAVYLGVREDRPDRYYIEPLRDFLSILRKDKAEIFTTVWTNREIDVSADRYVRHTLDDLVAKVWEETDWRGVYARLISNNPTHSQSAQAKYHDLIGVYLSKLALIQKEFEDTNADAVLWCDAGHWTSWVLGGDFNRYDASIQAGVSGILLHKTLSSAAKTRGVLGMKLPQQDTYHGPLSWMRDYWISHLSMPLFCGCFILVSRENIETLLCSFRAAWNTMIGDGKSGTEENALTLACWKNKWPCLPYEDWLNAFSGYSLLGHQCTNDVPPHSDA